MKLTSVKTAVAVAAGVFVLAACGGGGGAAPAAPTTVSGSGVKGPVFRATVTATPTSGPAIACGTTNAAGAYTCAIPAGTQGPFVITLSGGKFCSNESQVIPGANNVAANDSCAAPAVLKTQGATDNLSTVVLASQSNGTILPAPVTPFTTAAVNRAQADPAGLSAFVTQYAQLAATYGIDTNPTTAPDLGGATTPRVVALLSRIANDNSTLATAVANIQVGNDPAQDNPAQSDPFNAAVDTPGTAPDANTGTNGIGVSTGGGTVTGGTGATGGTTGGTAGGTAQAS